MKKLVNGIEVEMTPAEAAEFEGTRTLTLPKAKQRVRDLIKQRRDQAETGGFAYLTLRYPSDGNSLARISILGERARTAKAASLPLVVSMIAMDDGASNFNANELIALEVAAGDHFAACSENAKVLRQAVNAAVDQATLDAVNIEIGWP
jgi:DNA primase